MHAAWAGGLAAPIPPPPQSGCRKKGPRGASHGCGGCYSSGGRPRAGLWPPRDQWSHLPSLCHGHSLALARRGSALPSRRSRVDRVVRAAWRGPDLRGSLAPTHRGTGSRSIWSRRCASRTRRARGRARGRRFVGWFALFCCCFSSFFALCDWEADLAQPPPAGPALQRLEPQRREAAPRVRQWRGVVVQPPSRLGPVLQVVGLTQCRGAFSPFAFGM